MVHSVSGWTRGVQVKLWDPLRTRAILERLRVCSRRGAIQIHVYLTFTFTFTVDTLLYAVTLTCDLWPWTFLMHRLWQDETLYQIWAKSNNPRRSYCDLNIWPYDLEHVSRVALCFGIIFTKFKFGEPIRRWNRRIPGGVIDDLATFFQGKVQTSKLYSSEGSTKLHQIREEQSSVTAAPNAKLRYRLVASFRNEGDSKKSGIKRQGQNI